jgi:D-alanyl-D-alanine carboxypeptidase
MAARSGRRAAERREGTVGAHKSRHSGWSLFAVSVISVVVAVAILVFVAADRFGGGDQSPGGAPGGDAEATAPTPVPPTGTAQATPAPSPTERPTPGPDGTTVVACGDILVPLDKQHRLPADCEPPDLVRLPDEISDGGPQYLRREARDALIDLFDAARAAGFALTVNSSYRSYETQAQTYATWVQLYGEEYASRTSARPGHSEHQLGTTVDVGARGLVLEAFAGTPEAAWIEANAWKYGFIVSYPDGKEAITGYAYEPWHIRYVGRDVAAQVHRSGLTLREYLLQR